MKSKFKCLPTAKVAVEENGERSRANEGNSYSKEDLIFFKGLLLDNKKKAQDLVIFLESESKKVGNGTEDTDPPPIGEREEGDSFGYEKEKNQKLIYSQKKLIESIDHALIRIENGTYGICRETGLLIPKERLLLVPHTSYSVEVKNKPH